MPAFERRHFVITNSCALLEPRLAVGAVAAIAGDVAVATVGTIHSYVISRESQTPRTLIS